MIYRAISYLFLFLVSTVVTAADLSSRVEAVTVYPQGAMVTRVANAELVAGENEFRLVGLVSSIDIEFLNAEVADPDVEIGQIRLELEQEREAYDAEVARVQAEIVEVNGQIQAADDSIAAAQRRLKFLDGLAEGYAKEAWIEGSQGSASIDSLRAALELLQSGSEEASEFIRNKGVEKAELNNDVSVLQRTLADLRGGSLQTVVAELTLNAQAAVSTQILIRYFQEDAYWSPIYESRLDSNSGELRLMQQAEIQQETDEDWSNVSLTLSTSQPSGELMAPQLGSEFLDLIEPAQVQVRRNATMNMSTSTRLEDDQLEEIMVTGSRRANVGNFAVNYEIPGRTSVLNDTGEAITLDLASFEFNANLVTQVVPRESTQAFLAARFSYDQSVPLYASEMRVFVDGVFAGLSEMPDALPGSEILLPMGQDRRLEVRSESQGGEGGSSGFIGRNRTEMTDYMFEITNRRDRPSIVEVLDRIPVARNRDIEVEVPRTATPPDVTDLDDQPGLVQWQKSLAAGEVWRIRHQYTVTYPAKNILIRQ